MNIIKNNIFRITWGFFFIFVLFFIYINYNVPEIRYNLYSFHYIIIFVSFLLILFIKNPFKQIDYKKMLISFFLTFIYFLCSISNIFIEYLNNSDYNLISYYLLFTMSMASTFTLIYYILNLNLTCKPASEKLCLILLSIISSILILVVLTTFTGLYDLMIFDAWYSFSEFKEVSNWHGLGWSTTVALCRIIFSTPYPIVILQLLCFIYFLKQSIFFIGKKSKLGVILFSILILTNVSLLDSVRLLLPDTLCSICFFGFVLNLLFIIINYNVSLKNYIILTFAGIIIVTFRHATFFPIIITLLVLLFISIIKKEKESFKRIFLPTITIFLVKVFIFDIIITNIFNVVKYDKVHPYTIPLYIMSSLVYNDVIDNDEYLESVNNIIPIDLIKSNYSKYIPDTLLRDWSVDREYIEHINKIPTFDILSLNFRLFLEYPFEFLYEFFCMNNILWSFTDLYSDMYIVDLTDLYQPEASCFFDDYDEKYPIIVRNTILLKPINALFTKLYSIDCFRPFLLRNGVYAFLILLSSIILILKKHTKVLLSLLPIYLYFFLLMLSIQATATRYILPFMLISNFIIIFSITLDNKNPPV